MCNIQDGWYRPVRYTYTSLLHIQENLQNTTNFTFLLTQAKKKRCIQFPYIKTSLKHDPSTPESFSYSESLFCCKIGQVLQTSSHNQLLSCVLSKRVSNTFQSIHLSYPDHPLQSVTPLTHFSIFISKLCRLSSTA